MRHQIESNPSETEEPPGKGVDDGFSFVTRAEQELKRAERYLSFVSLVLFEVVPVSYNWDEELKKRVVEVARSSVRETDLVGVSNTHRVAVLLVETPRRGAERASERLSTQLLDFCLKEKGKSRLVTNIHSFPEDPQGKENFLSALEKLQ